jgi:hypothetical protein
MTTETTSHNGGWGRGEAVFMKKKKDLLSLGAAKTNNNRH